MSNVAKKCATLFALIFFSNVAIASTQSYDWLAFERTPVAPKVDRSIYATKNFDDIVVTTSATSRDVRSMMNSSDDFDYTVSELESSQEIAADAWIAGLPQKSAKPKQGAYVGSANSHNTQCQLNLIDGNYECASWSSEQVAAAKPHVTILAPATNTEIAKQELVTDEMLTSMLGVPVPTHANAKTATSQKNRTLQFYRGAAGLVTTEGGKIILKDAQETVLIQMAPEVKKKHISMFVRDPAMLAYDSATNQLRALNSGNTELFVVSQDRISIIPVSIPVVAVTPPVAVSKLASPKNLSPDDLELPSNLASVDVLDRAATGIHATYGGLTNSTSHKIDDKTPADLQVPTEMTALASTDDGLVTFVRAKAKASFGRMMVRLVDERSQWDGSRLYPVGGIRLRLIGTEFENRTDGQGYIEIPDMPVGARVFGEILDNSGAIMPGFVEIVYDASANSRERAQVVMVRRYLSLDYAARMAGVVQNMEMSSICSTILDSNTHRKPLAGIRVSTNGHAIGPFYFNEMGYVDTRLPATSANGRFCFFNVESGAVALGVQRGEQPIQVAVLMTARGKHSEEYIGLDDARHLTTTVAAVATAGDQLSSDMERANRYFAVEQAEVAIVGGKDQMVPIDEGVYTSGNPALPVRGRVWTVAASADFETSLQASSIKLPGSRQIMSLLPRGFIDDMANYAQQYQDPDLSTVVVEHAAISGQGDESVKIRLVDTTGHDVGDGWYFADSPTAKAVFFNVPLGVYSVVIETASGHWLAADTLMTDMESSTFVRTGAPLEKHLSNTSASN